MTEHLCVTLVPLFNQLDLADQKKINQIVKHRTFKKGEEIINPNAPEQLLIVARGALKVYQLSSNGKEQLLRVVEPGDYEGENQLFGAQNANLFVQALQPSEICFLTRQDFQQLLLEYPQLSLQLLEISGQKMTQLERQAQFLSLEKVEARLASYLLDLSKAADREEVVLPMKMKELATFLGTTPETLSRKFKNFEQAGWIKRQGYHVQLLDPDALEDL